ncbi:MAG: hypothetical protein L6R38_006905 [Xanthoria sp. 2 TBL-2021]|nr:MAG: hypothetical protein L6R38_006905 [Xanthoria sp. 2 TBL-2021]
MRYNIRKVGIVGGGPAGIATAKHLLAERHYELIDIFEQQASTGGVWNYSTYAPSEELSIPQTNPHQPLQEPRWQPSIGADTTPSKPAFATPMYDRLESNLPHFLMKHPDDDSLEHQPLFAGRESVLEYLNRYADDVRYLIKFQTQVYDIRKKSDGDCDKWLVCTRDLRSCKVSERLYDAVVVASGHHSVPVLPDIPGIRAWDMEHPGIITHSMYYRKPDSFKDKKVVVVGNSFSGLDIANQISTVSKHPVWNSERSKKPDFQSRETWKKEMVEIAEFISPSEAHRALRFADGQVVSDVDAVVFCTGYYYSFPFLSSLQPSVIVTGERVENLYQHIFYIDHPSIAFVGMPFKVIPFRTWEGQAAVIARVWSGRLELPRKEEMRAWESDRIADRGAGRKFHDLGKLEDFRYHNDLVDWALQAMPREDDRTPPKWSERDAWVRKNIPAIKTAFADKGDARHLVRSVEELGFEFQGEDMTKAF